MDVLFDSGLQLLIDFHFLHVCSHNKKLSRPATVCCTSVTYIKYQKTFGWGWGRGRGIVKTTLILIWQHTYIDGPIGPTWILSNICSIRPLIAAEKNTAHSGH